MCPASDLAVNENVLSMLLNNYYWFGWKLVPIDAKSNLTVAPQNLVSFCSYFHAYIQLRFKLNVLGVHLTELESD